MSLENFCLEYRRGVNETVQEIVEIVKNSKYPEDLEFELSVWLEEKGVKLHDN